MIIDAHAHFVPPAFLDEAASGRRTFPSVKVAVENGGFRFAFAGDNAKRPVPPGMSDADKRRKWLADHGIDKQVVGGWLDVFGYDIPAEEGADWSRYFNEHMLKGVKPHPFLVPLATVPLQSGKHAAKVLEEALDPGFPGAMIGTQPKGATGVLDDPDLDPFWEAASRRKATSVRASDLRRARRAAEGLRPGQCGRPRHRHHDRDLASALFRATSCAIPASTW